MWDYDLVMVALVQRGHWMLLVRSQYKGPGIAIHCHKMMNKIAKYHYNVRQSVYRSVICHHVPWSTMTL